MTSKFQNPVIVIALSLVMSIGLGVAMIWRVLGPIFAQHAAAAAAAVATKTPVAELKKRGWDFWTIEIENLSNELKEEKLKLRKQSDLLDQRAARLAAEEKEFAKLRADVEALRKEIADKVNEISVDEAKNLRALATTYAGLSPRAAVAILKEMDDATVVKILSLMKTETITALFEEMSRGGTPESPMARRAALLSEKLRLMKSNKPATPAS